MAAGKESRDRGKDPGPKRKEQRTRTRNGKEEIWTPTVGSDKQSASTESVKRAKGTSIGLRAEAADPDAGLENFEEHPAVAHTESGPQRRSIWTPPGEEPSEFTRRRASVIPPTDANRLRGESPPWEQPMPSERPAKPDNSIIAVPTVGLPDGYESHGLYSGGNVIGYASKARGSKQYSVSTASGSSLVFMADTPGEAGAYLLRSQREHARRFPDRVAPEGVTLEGTYADAILYNDYDFIYGTLKADMEENGDLEGESQRWNSEVTREFLDGVTVEGSWEDHEKNKVFEYVEGIVGHIRYEQDNQRVAPRSSYYT